jgi:hypothetical protein
MSDKKTNAELFEMLAERSATRNLSRSTQRYTATHDLRRSARSKSKEFAAKLVLSLTGLTSFQGSL